MDQPPLVSSMTQVGHSIGEQPDMKMFYPQQFSNGTSAWTTTFENLNGVGAGSDGAQAYP